MATDIEWKHRIERWRDCLRILFLRQPIAIDLQGFITNEQLTVNEAIIRDMQPMPIGTHWGAKWEYAWFKCTVIIPDKFKGKVVAFKLGSGSDESAIYINGEHFGAQDWGRREIILTFDATPGDKFEILAESYAGHGKRNSGNGPVPDGVDAVPEPPTLQQTVVETTVYEWCEEAYQSWIELNMLMQLSELVDQDSLRYSEIIEALRDFTIIADLELPYNEMVESLKAGRERLRPLFECINGTTAPTLFAFGHSHIDIAWLWPLRETASKCTRTFASQLKLMDQYPDYIFLQSQPYLYQLVKDDYPDLYIKIKEKIAEGRWLPEGGMWVEADTNISSGESLIRQLVHGKKFFREEFGVENEVLWLPDVFGYSGALPQIMRGCGIKYFSTQKIYCIYEGGHPFPYTTFTWEGIDGSEILVGMHYDYNSKTDPHSLNERWRERRQKIGLSTKLFPFGHGDGGGGATRDHLEYIKRSKNLEGLPKVQYGTLMDYFLDLEKRGYPDARYVGELYYQVHRGTLTTQAKTKLGNRKSEYALREAECWGILAACSNGYSYPYSAIDAAWKKVLLNQFHDIIPGSSIQRVYEEAEADYAEVINTAEDIASQAVATFTNDTDAITIFNSLNWNRNVLIPLPDDYVGASDINGKLLNTQIIENENFAEVTVPSCGWTTINKNESTETALKVTATDKLLENNLIKVVFNESGEITSIFDKENQFEFAAGPCNSFEMFKDVANAYEAWDINHTYINNPVQISTAAKIEVVSAGELAGVLRITKMLNKSLITLDVMLRRNSRVIEFSAIVDWKEKHKLLKVAFPVNIHANESLHEIQFGHIARPNHYSNQLDADRFEVSNHKWTALVENNHGFAVLNDCKYGVNVLKNKISLTLMRAPACPDRTCDIGIQQFKYAFYAWTGSIANSNLVQRGYELNIPEMIVSGAAGEKSIFNVDVNNIIIESIKPAEDASGDIVLRLYESMRMNTSCIMHINLPVKSIFTTNMLEEIDTEMKIIDNRISLHFRPFEIKTLRIQV